MEGLVDSVVDLEGVERASDVRVTKRSRETRVDLRSMSRKAIGIEEGKGKGERGKGKGGGREVGSDVDEGEMMSARG